jgi:hypothetical protein
VAKRAVGAASLWAGFRRAQEVRQRGIIAKVRSTQASLTLFRDVSMATSSTAPMHFAGTAQRGKNWWVLGRSRLREEVGCPFLPALPCTLPSQHTCFRHPESMTRKNSDCSLSQESVQPSIHSSCWRNRLETCIIGTSFAVLRKKLRSTVQNNLALTKTGPPPADLSHHISARSERSFYKSGILSSSQMA